MANINRTKVVTGVNTRLSYFHGWEPVSINGTSGDTELFEKRSDINGFRLSGNRFSCL